MSGASIGLTYKRSPNPLKKEALRVPSFLRGDLGFRFSVRSGVTAVPNKLKLKLGNPGRDLLNQQNACLLSHFGRFSKHFA